MRTAILTILTMIVFGFVAEQAANAQYKTRLHITYEVQVWHSLGVGTIRGPLGWYTVMETRNYAVASAYYHYLDDAHRRGELYDVLPEYANWHFPDGVRLVAFYRVEYVFDPTYQSPDRDW